MRLFSLGGRLQAAADFIPPHARIADIGTDHCRLPVWLIVTGKIDRAIASDIRELPLERGRETCRRFGVEDRVELRLGSGLEGISPDECTHIVICGMGGDNIAAILAAAPWTRDGQHELILQAETSAPDLRRWLYANGFTVAGEKAVLDAGRVYAVMRVTADESPVSGRLYEYVSAPLLEQNDEAAAQYIGRVIRGIQRELHGIPPETAEFSEKSNILALLKERIDYAEGQ